MTLSVVGEGLAHHREQGGLVRILPCTHSFHLQEPQ